MSDLISRDVLRKELSELQDMLPIVKSNEDKQSVRFAIKVVEGIIDNAPTVERQTGEILDYTLLGKNKYECSECGRKVSMQDVYCRQCGCVLLTVRPLLPKEGEEE